MTLKGLKTFNEVIEILNRNGITDVSTTGANKFTLVDLINIKDSNHTTGHSVLLVRFNPDLFYYFDPIGTASKSVLNKFCPNGSRIMCSLDQLQAINNEDCTNYVIREVLLLASNRLSINNYVLLRKDSEDNYVIESRDLKGLDKNKLNHANLVENNLINQ